MDDRDVQLQILSELQRLNTLTELQIKAQVLSNFGIIVTPKLDRAQMADLRNEVLQGVTSL